MSERNPQPQKSDSSHEEMQSIADHRAKLIETITQILEQTSKMARTPEERIAASQLMIDVRGMRNA